MEKIEVVREQDTEYGWLFNIRAGKYPDMILYSVKLREGYFQKLTNEQVKPSKLVIESFKFLLQKEPKESILKSFDLSEIQNYFPEYEQVIKSRI